MKRKKDSPGWYHFNEIIEGVEHSFRISKCDGKFSAEKDGMVIARLARYEVWEQEYGQPLNPQLFEMLVHKIDEFLNT
jgi:hypothetical protein